MLEDKRANGLINFAYAVEFVKGRYGNGLFVSYYNTGDVQRIHRGTRVMEHCAYTDDVFSVKILSMVVLKMVSLSKIQKLIYIERTKHIRKQTINHQKMT